jgi:hypothetical protein
MHTFFVHIFLNTLNEEVLALIFKPSHKMFFGIFFYDAALREIYFAYQKITQ